MRTALSPLSPQPASATATPASSASAIASGPGGGAPPSARASTSPAAGPSSARSATPSTGASSTSSAATCRRSCSSSAGSAAAWASRQEPPGPRQRRQVGGDRALARQRGRAPAAPARRERGDVARQHAVEPAHAVAARNDDEAALLEPEQRGGAPRSGSDLSRPQARSA